MKQHRLFGHLLAAGVPPFLMAGILVPTMIAMWIAGSGADERGAAFMVAALLLVATGILLGDRIAYGAIVFFLKWIKSDHALLAFADIESGLGRHLNCAFRAVHDLAIFLAPKRP